MTERFSTDERVAGQVGQALAKDPEVDIHDLRVDVVDGMVHLSGVCSSLREVRRAGEVAARLPGVRAVDNLVAVECAHPFTDQELQDAARTAAASVDPGVEVEVEDGIAVLRGEVERPGTVDGVCHAVEGIPGVKELRSEVTFTALTAGERALRRPLEQALRGAYPVPGAIRVAEVHDGRITLEGRVSTAEERDRVLEAARAVPGVDQVQHRIRIRPNKPEGAQGRHGRAA